MSADHHKWHINVEMILSRLQRDGQVMTYLDMVTEADIPSPYRIHQLAEFLETLIKRDIRLGQPIVAARVVSKRHGLPADGFFDCLDAEGVLPRDDENRTAFHQRLLDQV